MSYQYPISLDWKTDEIVVVVEFFNCIEIANEKGIERDVLMNAYRKFKEIVPGKADEKKLCAQFEDQSGYSCYRTIQKARETQKNIVKM
ncbi:uncharacterized protein YktA (UPF0223 family) [Bacillus mesophilus]|uniref:UPF0223 protein G4D63_01450 n=1 Tax=Bacillus mesophilus TaxID=1808955 RepID=A0A6M0Q210_9BACI|nr:UPF0223 family protein [Bacillus mesophilus]MBM7659522.1 uncharacterized protein YktA (UPF0223 family) [Bacillus mesophilus]NEY70395.1 UPF0223 family protein [Bacillus mesophilus]